MCSIRQTSPQPLPLAVTLMRPDLPALAPLMVVIEGKDARSINQDPRDQYPCLRVCPARQLLPVAEVEDQEDQEDQDHDLGLLRDGKLLPRGGQYQDQDLELLVELRRLFLRAFVLGQDRGLERDRNQDPGQEVILGLLSVGQDQSQGHQ